MRGLPKVSDLHDMIHKLQAENDHLRSVICSALDDLECNDETGCLAILKTAYRQMQDRNDG